MNIGQLKQRIQDLVTKYEKDDTYRGKSYSEAQVRTDFIDPFFENLGWDIANRQSRLVNDREVIVEEPLRVQESNHAKKPDYTFRLFSNRKFFVEAKKPSIDIVNGSEEAHQIRRYGYTAGLAISVLTNFEYLTIYDCSRPVLESDSADNYVLVRYHYTEYVEKFEEILEKIGKDAVYTGGFDNYWSEIESKIEKYGVDKRFLSQINNWRLLIAKDLTSVKPDIDMDLMNDLIQSYINSIIFLRVAEDRGLEDDFNLYHIAEKQSKQDFISRLKESNKKYNAGLFELPYIDEFLENQDSSIWSIINELYYPQSSYSFSVLPHDILGQVYEIFLGDKAELVDGNITLTPKDIERDVITTPSYIIQYIIKNTVSNKLIRIEKPTSSFKSYYIEPDQLLELRFADISCGSGAFLLELFQSLQDIMIDCCIYYNDYSKLAQVNDSTFRLNFETKKKILTDCIYGVDKDFNAVKATKFGLLLKLLEGETNSTISSPALPNLDNIIFGNSLVDTDDALSEEALDESNPADIRDLRFDFIIGNPPYLATEHIKRTVSKEEFNIYKSKYKSAFKQYDKYYLFIERAKELLNEKGRLSYIIPSKFIKIKSGEKIRKVLGDDGFLRSIVYFGSNQIFNGKTTYTSIIYCQKSKPVNEFSFIEVDDLPLWKVNPSSAHRIIYPLEQIQPEVTLPKSIMPEGWVLKLDEYEYYRHIVSNYEEVIGETFEVCNGIQTSTATYIHKPKRMDKDYVWFDYKDRNGVIKEYCVERILTRPYYATERNNPVYTYKDFQPNRIVIYPYINKDGVARLVDINTIQRKYPNLYSFLIDVKDILEDRKLTEKTTALNWHRYGRHQNINTFDVDQKVIVGILSQGEKYSIDNYSTAIPAGGTAGYCFIKIPEDSSYSIYFLQAILHSKYLEYQARIFGKTFENDFVSRGKAEISKMRFPKVDFENKSSRSLTLHNDIATLQKRLNELYSKIEQNSENERLKTKLVKQFKRNEYIINERLKEFFNLPNNIKLPEVKDMYSS